MLVAEANNSRDYGRRTIFKKVAVIGISSSWEQPLSEAYDTRTSETHFVMVCNGFPSD
jgi:hypothetical protein